MDQTVTNDDDWKEVGIWEVVKKCATCGEYKPVSEFGKHSRTSDGIRGSCKECNNLAKERYRAAHKAEVAAYAREYRQQPMAAWKNRVRQETRTLILSGVILHPGCCEVCGLAATEETIQCHHNSYNVPDDVTFMCKSCHTAWHNENDTDDPDLEWVNEWYNTKQDWPN